MLVVVALWVAGGGVQALSGWADGLTTLGRLTGLVSANLLLIQVLLMARVPAVERVYGQDELARRHRLVGFWSFWLMVAHLVLVTAGYALTAQLTVFAQFWELVVDYPGMLLALRPERTEPPLPAGGRIVGDQERLALGAQHLQHRGQPIRARQRDGARIERPARRVRGVEPRGLGRFVEQREPPPAYPRQGHQVTPHDDDPPVEGEIAVQGAQEPHLLFGALGAQALPARAFGERIVLPTWRREIREGIGRIGGARRHARASRLFGIGALHEPPRSVRGTSPGTWSGAGVVSGLPVPYVIANAIGYHPKGSDRRPARGHSSPLPARVRRGGAIGNQIRSSGVQRM